jgi:hypothetical protein
MAKEHVTRVPHSNAGVMAAAIAGTSEIGELDERKTRHGMSISYFN